MARGRTTAERRANHNRIKKVTAIVGVGGAALAAGGALFGHWLSGSESSPSEARPSASPTYHESDPFTSDAPTFDVSPEPRRSSVDDITETPTDGWTSDAPKKSPSPKASSNAEHNAPNPCHWDTTKIKKAGTTAIIAEVRGYDECVDGDLRDAMKVYRKPTIEANVAFNVSNAQTIEIGCKIEDTDWYLARSSGIAGDNRGFIQGSVIGEPKINVCPPNYQQIANEGGRR